MSKNQDEIGLGWVKK